MVHAKVIGFANEMWKKSKVSDFPYGSSQSNWFWQGNEKKSKVIGFDDGTSWNVWGKPRRTLF
jgi:hypothetical protein